MFSKGVLVAKVIVGIFFWIISRVNRELSSLSHFVCVFCSLFIRALSRMCDTEKTQKYQQKFPCLPNLVFAHFSPSCLPFYSLSRAGTHTHRTKPGKKLQILTFFSGCFVFVRDVP